VTIRPLWILAAVLTAVLVTSCGSSEVSQPASNRGKVTHEYVIPKGTWERTARGEDVKIVPAQLDVRVGDTLRIRNEDVGGQEVGIFNVGPGQTVTMKFTTPGELSGGCTLHPGGKFTIKVADA
jgi:plastocyanin